MGCLLWVLVYILEALDCVIASLHCIIFLGLGPSQPQDIPDLGALESGEGMVNGDKEEMVYGLWGKSEQDEVST